ncbi:MAG: glycosyltransferase family 2 protein [Vicinamibacterales bacterium]
MPRPITAVLLTFNEAPNLGRTLARLSFATDIVVVDSGSSDATTAIAAAHPKVRVFSRAFTTHAEQWNFALHETGIATEWVLALDADFVLADAAVAELAAFEPGEGIDGYWASFDYCINGRPLRGAAYPPVVVLYRRAGAVYLQDGHTQRVRVDGRLGWLAGRIRHDDRKPLSQWLAAQSRYMRLEVEKLTGTPPEALTAIDRVRRLIVVMPPAMFVYCYLVRGGILDGTAGLYYALQRSAAELILALYLVERRIAGDPPPGPPPPGQSSLD